MKKLTMLLACLLFIGLQVSFAQKKQITGTVTHSQTGDIMPGVTVMVKGFTGMGTITNADGKYALMVPNDAERLTFSFVGMKSKDVIIGGQSVINVALEPDLLGIEEVVVTGLGISREKKGLGYAVQDIKGDELVKAKEENIVNSLSGKISGVQVTNSSGAVGSGSRIIIRGNNSLTGENQPLFVVDGVPISNSYSSLDAYGGVDFGNAAADISGSDIESVSVLKGGAAAAIYGSRAANGVILITTKKGSGTKGLGISFETSWQWDSPLILPDYQNEYGQGYNGEFEYIDGAGAGTNDNVDESWGPRLDGRLIKQFNSPYDPATDTREATPWVANPDNIKNLFQTGLQKTTNLSLQGSNDKSHIRLSLTNFDQMGTLVNTDLKKYTVLANGGTYLTDKFSVNFSANYIKNKSDNIPGNGYSSLNILQQSSWFGRQVDTEYLKENWDQIDPKTGGPVRWNNSYHDNPFWTLNKNTNSRERDRVIGNVTFQYDFYDWLNLKASVGNDFYTESRMQKRAMYSNDWPKGQFNSWTRSRNELNANILLSFSKDITEDLNIMATAGGNYMHQNWRDQSTDVAELIIPDLYSVSNANVPATTSLYFGRKEIQSVYGTANIGFKRWLFLDLTVRNDWSSTLPEESNSYFYPSASLGFIFTDAFGIDSDVLSFGKLRGGWAKVGNDAPIYRLAGTYGAATPFDGKPSLTFTGTIPPLGLTPEFTTTSEVGAEMKFFNNRLGFDLTLYRSLTTNQIMNVEVSRSTGFGSKTINSGEVQNQGIELLVNATPVKTSDFMWDMTINYGKNDSKVLSLHEDMQYLNIYSGSWSMYVQARPGQPYGTMYGRGIVRENRIVETDEATGNELVRYEGRAIIDPTTGGYFRTPENVVLGNVLPDWTGGIRNTFAYKNLDLSFMIDAKIGGDMYSVTNWFGSYSGVLAETAAFNDNGVNIREPFEDGGGLIVDGIYGGLDDDGNVIFTDGEGNQVSDAIQNSTKIVPQDYFEGYWGKTELGIFDASYVKLREIILGYTIKPEFLRKIGFSSANISLVGRNLAILYKNMPHIDPENSFSAGNTQGVESNMIPSSRSIGFSLKLTL